MDVGTVESINKILYSHPIQELFFRSLQPWEQGFSLKRL